MELFVLFITASFSRAFGIADIAKFLKDEVYVSDFMDREVCMAFPKSSATFVYQIQSKLGLGLSWNTVETQMDSNSVWKMNIGTVARAITGKPILPAKLLEHSEEAKEFRKQWLEKYWDVIELACEVANIDHKAVELTLEKVVRMIDHLLTNKRTDAVRLNTLLDAWDIDLENVADLVLYVLQALTKQDEEITVAEFAEKLGISEPTLEPIIEVTSMIESWSSVFKIETLMKVVGVLFDVYQELAAGVLSDAVHDILMEPLRVFLNWVDLSYSDTEDRLTALIECIDAFDNYLMMSVFGSREARDRARGICDTMIKEGIDLCATAGISTKLMETITVFLKQTISDGFDSLKKNHGIDVKLFLDDLISGKATSSRFVDVFGVFGLTEEKMVEVFDSFTIYGKPEHVGPDEYKGGPLLRIIADEMQQLYKKSYLSFREYTGGKKVTEGIKSGLNQLATLPFAKVLSITGWANEANVKNILVTVGKLGKQICEHISKDAYIHCAIKPLVDYFVGKANQLFGILEGTDPTFADIIDCLVPKMGKPLASLIADWANKCEDDQAKIIDILQSVDQSMVLWWETCRNVAEYPIPPERMTAMDLLDCVVLGDSDISIYSIYPIHQLPTIGTKCRDEGFSTVTISDLEQEGVSVLEPLKLMASGIKGLMDYKLCQLMVKESEDQTWVDAIDKLAIITEKASKSEKVTCTDVDEFGEAFVIAMRNAFDLRGKLPLWAVLAIVGACVFVLIISLVSLYVWWCIMRPMSIIKPMDSDYSDSYDDEPGLVCKT